MICRQVSDVSCIVKVFIYIFVLVIVSISVCIEHSLSWLAFRIAIISLASI